ncbi:hypothetical protein NDU88_003011 [Pleurodeles waltl]|uniref:Uncharacterized protein n=1 Tax=Pleurodeles waltl TaxID=8319 RepID=A0AAV7UX94_PLEWA|nr:hypothetical protein NDU88_003011 [Pleurodeles waltl]
MVLRVSQKLEIQKGLVDGAAVYSVSVECGVASDGSITKGAVVNGVIGNGAVIDGADATLSTTNSIDADGAGLDITDVADFFAEPDSSNEEEWNFCVDWPVLESFIYGFFTWSIIDGWRLGDQKTIYRKREKNKKPVLEGVFKMCNNKHIARPFYYPSSPSQ